LGIDESAKGVFEGYWQFAVNLMKFNQLCFIFKLLQKKFKKYNKNRRKS